MVVVVVSRVLLAPGLFPRPSRDVDLVLAPAYRHLRAARTLDLTSTTLPYTPQ